MHTEYVLETGTRLAITEIGSAEATKTHLVWGHGWGHSAAALTPLAENLKPFASSSVIDFPGFGRSSSPPDHWGTAEYADETAKWLVSLPAKRVVWIGHSFGGRVGLQLAARHPHLLSGMVLIAGAGLPRKRSLPDQFRLNLKRMAFKTAKRFIREGPELDRLRQRFGSSDYRNAGTLRPVMTRVVSENLTDIAKAVQIPTLLIYGTADTETPPEMGQRLNSLIARSELVLLEGFNHVSILFEGRHQVVLRIRKFLEQIKE